MKLQRSSLNFFYVILWSTCYRLIIKIQLFHAVLLPYRKKDLDAHRMWYYLEEKLPNAYFPHCSCV